MILSIKSHKNLYRSVVITVFLTCVCLLYGKNQEIAAQSNQNALQQVAAYNFGSVNAITSGSDRFFMSSGRAVRMFDAVNPGQLTEIEHIVLPDIVRALSLYESTLAAALENGKIQLIDVSTFDQLDAIMLIENLPTVRDVMVMNELLIVAVGQDGTWVFDISNTENPVKVSEIPVSIEDGVIRELIGLDQHHFVTAGDKGWHIYDVSNPSFPDMKAEGNRDYSVRSLAVEGSTLFVAYQSDNDNPRGRIGIYDVAELSSPVLITEQEFNVPMFSAYMMVENGVLALNSSITWVLDVKNPAEPEILTTNSQRGRDIALSNNHIYLLENWRRSVRIWELTDQNKLNSVQTILAGTSLSFIRMHGDRIFVTNRYQYQSLVSELHFSRIDHELTWTNGILMDAKSVFPSDKLMFTGAWGLLVDISDSQNYRVLGTVPGQHLGNVGDRRDAAWISDDLLLTLVNGMHKGDKAGLELFDVSDSENPQLLDFYGTGMFNNRKVLVIDTLIIQTQDNGINFFTLTTNKKIERLSGLKKTWLRNAAAVRDHYLYVIQSSGVGGTEMVDSLMIVDFSDPYNPFVVEQKLLEQRSPSLKVHDDFLFIMTSEHNIQVYSLANPSRPEFMHRYEFEESPNSFAIDKRGYLFTTHGDVGLKVWMIPEVTSTESSPEIREVPEKFTLGQNFPNPFNPTTRIPFELPESSEVRLEVYDLLGRRVTILTDRRYQEGRHEMYWDATDMSSGVYLIRMIIESDGGYRRHFNRRATLIK